MAGAPGQIPQQAVDAFEASLRAFVPKDARIGIAVSGGPDSLALLLLAARVRRGSIEAASVDHGLREGSAAEADLVANQCRSLGVPHQVLTLDWAEKPTTAIQERARIARYARLVEWAKERGITVLMTAHHADDQAETMLMRLARGAGVTGLAGIRPVARIPGTDILLVRPLLGWPKRALEQVCADAGLAPVTDPSNADDQFERARVRKALAAWPFLPPQAVAQSAAHLADADIALAWAADREYARVAQVANDGSVTLDPSSLPPELLRRLAIRAIGSLATEGRAEPVRGREIDRLLTTLAAGESATLKGVACTGGERWTFAKAPPRTAKPTEDHA